MDEVMTNPTGGQRIDTSMLNVCFQRKTSDHPSATFNNKIKTVQHISLVIFSLPD